MDTAQKNKMREKLQIERFVKLLGYQENDILCPDADPPDAFIKSKDGLISLEHTRIIQNEDRPTETIREKCIRQAKAQWTDDKLPTVRVDVLFNEPAPASYSQIDQYSDRIQSMIFNFSGPLHDLKSRIRSGRITCYVALSIPGSRNHWTCVDNHVGCVKKISESRLKNIISRKNKAIPRYCYKSSEAWLLLFIESEYASSMFSLETRYEHESNFDKVYISDGFEYVEIHKRPVI